MIPVLLALLVVLWAGGNGDEGEHGSMEWRFLVLKGWFMEAVTLLSMGIQVMTGLQSLICTSLSAAVVLETSGVPVSQIAEMSMMRGVNDGPWRLIFLTLSGSWRSIFSLQPFLVVMLYLGTVATQFGSTILVTDLDTRAIVGNANATLYNMTVSGDILVYKPLPVTWYIPPEYGTFAEVPTSVNSAPSARGFSDTGNTKRFFLSGPRNNITKIRSYEGAAYGWNSRVSCVPPKLQGRFNITKSGTTQRPFTLSLKGNISYEDTFAAAGMAPVARCAGGNCLPQNFNCTLVIASNVGMQGVSICIPSVDNTVQEKPMKWLSDPRDGPINANSMVFLMSKTNGTYYNWTSVFEEPQLPSASARVDEWSEWTLANSTKFSVSLCFASSVWERSDIKASTPRDTFIAKPQEQLGAMAFDTTLLRKQLGATSKLASNTERGIFSVDSVTNTTWGTKNTMYLDTSPYYLFGGTSQLGGYGFVMHTSGGGSGASTVNPYMDFSGTLEDVLLDTGRPALAIQAMLGIKALNTFYALGTYMVGPREPVRVTETVMTQAPVRWTGLLCFVGIVVLNYFTVVAITASFLLRTRYSKQGHFWHTISQVITDDTVTILQHAAESRDDHAMARTNTFNNNSSLTGTSSTTANNQHRRGAAGISRKPSYKLEQDPVVVVSRSVKTGRVQVIRKDELGNV